MPMLTDEDGAALPQASAALAAPCPFCGGSADGGALGVFAIAEDDDGEDLWQVTCDGCGCYGPMMDTPASAVARWNSRPGAPAAQAAA